MLFPSIDSGGFDLGLLYYLGLSRPTAFGYPWHGKWETNSSGKDVLTLVTDTGEERPAPTGKDGSTIPRLASGVHLIDVQMPWAKHADTSAAIRALGGKFWDRALYCPTSGRLYGKNIFRDFNDGDGKPPGGRVDFLYGAPDGSIWACALYVSYPGGLGFQGWRPGTGEVAPLRLHMRQVAGKFGRVTGEYEWREHPLGGTNTLNGLFPNIIAEAEACFDREGLSFSEIVRVLKGGVGDFYPMFDFLDAVPDGKRALYGLRVSNAANLPGSQGVFNMIVALVELSLSGTPGKDLVARVRAERGPAGLLSGQEESHSSYSGGAGGPLLFHVLLPGTISYNKVDSEEFKPYGGVQVSLDFRGYAEEYTTHQKITGMCTLLAGYDSAGQIVTRQLTYSWESDSDNAWKNNVLSNPGALSHHQWVSFSYSHGADNKRTTRASLRLGDDVLFEGYEYHHAVGETVTQDFVTQLWETSIVFPPGTGAMDPVTATHTSGGNDQRTGSIQAGPINKPCSGDTDVLSSATTLPNPWSKSCVMQSTPLSVGVYLGVITPQVVHVSYASGSTPGESLWHVGHVITLGNARSRTTSPARDRAYTPNISWCPVRDQLLVTDTPSSWV